MFEQLLWILKMYKITSDLDASCKSTGSQLHDSTPIHALSKAAASRALCISNIYQDGCGLYTFDVLGRIVHQVQALCKCTENDQTAPDLLSKLCHVTVSEQAYPLLHPMLRMSMTLLYMPAHHDHVATF